MRSTSWGGANRALDRNPVQVRCTSYVGRMPPLSQIPSPVLSALGAPSRSLAVAAPTKHIGVWEIEPAHGRELMNAAAAALGVPAGIRGHSASGGAGQAGAILVRSDQSMAMDFGRISDQLVRCLASADSRGDNVGWIVVGSGISGLVAERPDLRYLLALARERHSCGWVEVADADRISRDQGTVKAFSDELLDAETKAYARMGALRTQGPAPAPLSAGFIAPRV